MKIGSVIKARFALQLSILFDGTTISTKAIIHSDKKSSLYWNVFLIARILQQFLRMEN